MPTVDRSFRVLVLGGTGHYGRHIVQNLLAKGFPVRVLSRDPFKARQILGDQPQITAGDVISIQSIPEIFNDVTTVIIALSAMTPKLIRKLSLIERDAVLSVLDLARRRGVRRIVYLSGYEMRPSVIDELDLEVGRIKLEVERALANSDFDWTVLGAAASMEIFFAMLRGNRMLVPGGGPPALPTVSPVDVGEIDVGEIAAQTVLREDLGGKRIRVTGPEAVSFPDAAKRISEVTGKPITFAKIPLMPLRIASVVTRPFTPYLRHLMGFVRLLNQFPQDLAALVPQDHQWLVSTFDYTPTTLEMEAQRRTYADNARPVR
jgi:uncharacterized protein YbjT (DUF2867 family)